jgi:ABC-2 type transport system ATP-binding protein
VTQTDTSDASKSETSDVTALEIEGLVKKYRGFKLGPLDLKLNTGTVLGLVGPNGSGKTTTLNTIVGLIRKDRGSVRIFGRETRPNDARWKFDIGYVGDTHAFYEYWSGERNLRFLSEFYPTWDHAYAAKLADRFQLNLKKRANSLSKGNRAKLALIGVLAHYPKLILLDEPTSGLDPVVRTEFLDVLWETMEGGNAAILYSTHILSDISRIADELAFLDEGKITMRPAKDDLLDKWRRVSFKYRGTLPAVRLAADVHSDGANHLVISSDYEGTIAHLYEIGVENVEVSMMTVDEITVHILKGRWNV